MRFAMFKTELNFLYFTTIDKQAVHHVLFSFLDMLASARESLM